MPRSPTQTNILITGFLMTTKALHVFNADETAALLGFPDLVEAISAASIECAQGAIDAPESQVVELANGAGVMLSMPATAPDIAIHKLVNVVPANPQREIRKSKRLNSSH